MRTVSEPADGRFSATMTGCSMKGCAPSGLVRFLASLAENQTCTGPEIRDRTGTLGVRSRRFTVLQSCSERSRAEVSEIGDARSKARQQGESEMKTRHGLFFVALLLLEQAAAFSQQTHPAPLRVLFIGNSYTAANNLPAILEGLADAAGGRKIRTDRHLVGGCTLQRHVQQKRAVEKIEADKWDAVVLQEQSLRAVLDRQSLHKYARFLDAKIKQQGAKTVFYLTWARRHIPDMQAGADPAASPEYARAMYQISGSAKAIDFDAWCRQQRAGLQGGLNGAYFDIAQELGAQVAPVGIAWKKALAAEPAFVLHRPDKSHPNPTGTYLAACVFYATLLAQSPVGLPCEVKQGARVLVRIPGSEAKRLQEIAWQTVGEAKQRQAVQPASPGVPRPSGRTTAGGATKLPFDTYSGYFVSNQYEPRRAASFVVMEDRKKFDKVFGVAVVMNDRSHRLPDDAFKANVVLAAIKRGQAYWEFRAERVSVRDGVVELGYTTTSEKSDSATFACPLIVSIPRGQYRAVRFMENGKLVREVEIGKK